jgi:ABC-type dipeptide/oligopeptide/nickel transport system permease component
MSQHKWMAGIGYKIPAILFSVALTFFGLHLPLYQQFFHYISKVLHGDL